MKKKFLISLLVVISLFLIVGCGSNKEEGKEANNKKEEKTEEKHKPVTIKDSPDKYTWYIKDYVGENCANVGYLSLGGDILDRYGAATVEIVFMTKDGEFIDIEDEDKLKDYVVVAQNLEPNTELKLTLQKDSKGEEYSNLTDHVSIETIILGIRKITDKSDVKFDLTAIKPADDKYTWYIKDYVGLNLGNVGYISLGGDRRDSYGHGSIKIKVKTEDGSYVDPTDKEAVKGYVVTAQNIEPNTQLKYTFSKDSKGKEYSNLINTQTIEDITLTVKKLGE